MRFAVYARFSSENQRPTSIDDQVLSCRRFARERGFLILDDHIYTDQAQSGARWDRPGLGRLRAAAADRLIDGVLIDDLSRLARANYFMLQLVAEFHYEGVRLISIADNVDTEDAATTLPMQLRGVFNELMLADLRQKTLRGQIGQKNRGYFVGEATFGYRSVADGTVRVDKAGQPRPDGYLMRVDPQEQAVVLRIFQAYTDGESCSAIVRSLNSDGVPGRIRSAKGWSTGSVTRILDNEKYRGHWVWNRWGGRRDPHTGRRRYFEKPRDEWVVVDDEALRIVPQPLWDSVRQGRDKVRGTWPGGVGRRGFSREQGSRVKCFPAHLLSGAMVCGWCGGSIALVGGKAGGYFGCLAARNAACDNKLHVRRRLAEKIVLDAVRERLDQTEAIHYVFERVVQELAKLSAHLPETTRLKNDQLRGEQRRLDNLVEYIANGEATPAVQKALKKTEHRVSVLEAELGELRFRSQRLLEAPSLPWLRSRLGDFRALLDESVQKAALILRDVFGKITLVPVAPDTGRPYYLARTHLETLKLLEDPDPNGGSDPGSTSIGWWTQSQRCRTLARLSLDVEQRDPIITPVSQVIASEVAELRARGETFSAIAGHFGVTPKTVKKALRWFGPR